MDVTSVLVAVRIEEDSPVVVAEVAAALGTD